MLKQDHRKKDFRRASLRQPRSARTVLLRMAADQERADRIRALKQARPDLTWRRIADHVGVTERAAGDWQKKGGMEYANAVKLAELFEVDVDYIWRGTETDTPDPFEPDGNQLDRIEARLDEARTEQDRISALIEKQNALLDRQEGILKRIEAATRANDTSTQRLAEASNLALQRLRELESAAESPAATQPETAGSDNPPASN